MVLENKINLERESQIKLAEKVEKLDSDLSKAEDEFQQISKESQEAKADLLKFERSQVELKETEKHLNSKRKKLSKLISEEKRKKMDDETWIINFDADVAKAESQRDEAAQRLEKEEFKFQDMQQELQGFKYL